MQIQTYDTTLTNAEQTELQRALDLEADGLFDDGNTARARLSALAKLHHLVESLAAHLTPAPEPVQEVIAKRPPGRPRKARSASPATQARQEAELAAGQAGNGQGGGE